MNFSRLVPWALVAVGLGALVWLGSSGSSDTSPTPKAGEACATAGAQCHLGGSKLGVCTPGPGGLTCADQH